MRSRAEIVIEEESDARSYTLCVAYLDAHRIIALCAALEQVHYILCTWTSARYTQIYLFWNSEKFLTRSDGGTLLYRNICHRRRCSLWRVRLSPCYRHFSSLEDFSCTCVRSRHRRKWAFKQISALNFRGGYAGDIFTRGEGLAQRRHSKNKVLVS